MAKKKTEDELIIDEISQVEKSIKGEYGDGILVNAKTILDEPVMIIPFSPALDPALSGGIPEGVWVIFTGPPKVGKTSSLLDFCATCQLPEYGGRDIYYEDIEGRLKKMNLSGVKGLNLDKFHVIRSTKGTILNAEQYLDIGIRVLENHPGCVLVLDSIGALCGANEMSKEVSEATMGGTSQAQSRFVRKAANILPINKNIIIAITHRTASLAKFGAAEREKTSNALAYQADVKLWAKKSDPWVVGTKQIGQIVNWKIVTSALGPPGGEAQSYLRYGHGIDKLTELIVMATDLGLLEKQEKGGWYTFECDGAQKIQGLEKVYQFFMEDPKRQEFIKTQIQGMLS